MNQYEQITNILNKLIDRNAIFEIEPKYEKLTYDTLRNLNVNNILYTEYAFPGAMGGERVIIQYLTNQNHICYELDDYESNEDIFTLAVNFINECSIIPEGIFNESIIELTDKFPLKNIEKGILIHYGGGAGNNAYRNKNINLKITKDYFIYSIENINFRIYSSCKGVFLAVKNRIQEEAGIKIHYPIPKIGVFWLHYKNNEVKIFYKDDIELKQGQEYNNYLIYPTGHYETWETLKYYGLVPKSYDYDDLPRGQIAFDNSKSEYVIYCGNWVDSASGIKSLIKDEFKIWCSFRFERDYQYKNFKHWGY